MGGAGFLRKESSQKVLLLEICMYVFDLVVEHLVRASVDGFGCVFEGSTETLIRRKAVSSCSSKVSR